ncbi:MAG: DUF58 domain-containing protein [Candidatus Firestonebacteria bacterium]
MGKYFAPEELAKFAGFQVMAKNLVHGFLAGLHPALRKGVSTDFSEHREYSFGDETKRIDWKVLAKSDRYFIREYREEANLSCSIFLDASASMEYASGQISKYKYSVFLSAALAYLMTIQQDKTSLVIFDDRIRSFIPSKSGKKHLSVIFEELENSKPSGSTMLPEVLLKAAGMLKKRGITVLITDLYGDAETIIKNTKYLLSKKNEVIVFQVLDEDELALPFKESFLFESLESGASVLALPSMIREEYKRIMLEFTNKYRKEFSAAGVDYTLLSTKTPVEEALLFYLERRARVV